MPDAELPRWLDEVDVHTVAVLTLDDGERITAEVLNFDDERGELVVDVLSSVHASPKVPQRGRAILVGRIVSVEPRPRAEQPWPYSDPCRSASFSLSRFVPMAALFLCATVGGLALFLLLMKRPYGLQEASLIVYTLAVVFGTFARIGSRGGKDLPPFMFTCPAVHPQIPRLLWRHVGFLAALFILQTAAVVARPKMPDWWNTPDKKGGTPFELALFLMCFGIGAIQVSSNRSILGRAHREFSRQG